MKTNYKNLNKILNVPSLNISVMNRVIAGIFIFLLISINGFAQENIPAKEQTAFLKNSSITKNVKSVWNVLFTWPVSTQYNCEAGAETDGTNVFTSVYNADKFYKYSMTGTIVDSFSIPGVTAIRDLAYDGTYFYGGSNGANIYQMDFTNHTLVSTIACPTGITVRHIAYDPVNDAFWVGGWNSGNRDIKLINRSGALINTIPESSHGLSSIWGTAYDGWTAGGPYLWAFDQSMTGNNLDIYQINISTGLKTGVYHNCKLDVGSGIANPTAGGLFTYHDSSTGVTMLGGCIQMARIFAYDLSSCYIPSQDVGVIKVTSPASNCELSNSEAITVKVKNFGSAPVTNCQISYELAIFQTDTETISQTIQPGDTIDFTFSKHGNFTNLGGYLLIVNTMLTGDESNINDTIKAAIYHSTAANLPYTMGFESNEDKHGWTIIDANNDQFTWYYDNAHMRTGNYGCTYYYNSDAITPADDWIISNCVNLDQGVNYQFSFWYRTAGTNYPENLSVYYGTQPNAASMTTELVNLANINNSSYLESKTNFTAPATGTYYFGWHAHSLADEWYINFDDVSISDATGLEKIDDKDAINMYLKGNSTLHIESDKLVSSVKIWNSTGRIIYYENKDFLTTDINIADYSSGIYMVQLKTSKGFVSKKIVF